MQVEYQRLFKKKFRKLNPKIKQAFYKRLELFSINKFDPILNNHPLQGKYLGCYSFNVTGDYRVIFTELKNGDKEHVVILFDIDTHSGLYGR